MAKLYIEIDGTLYCIMDDVRAALVPTEAELKDVDNDDIMTADEVVRDIITVYETHAS